MNATSPSTRGAAIATVSLLILCQSFQGLVSGGVALFLPRIRDDLELTFTQAGSLSAVSTFVYALMQIPAGFLADRYGPRKLFFIGALGTNVFGLGFGMVTNLPLALINQGCAGFFRSMLFSPGLVLITSWFPPERRATAMGLFVAGGFSSNIVLNLVGPPMEEAWGWRVPFFVFAGIGIAAAFTYLRFSKTGPGLRQGGSDMREALRLFRYRVMWVLGAIQYVRLAAVQGLAFWLPSFFVDERDLSLAASGLLIAIGGLLTAPSNFLGGYVSDRLRNPYLVIGTSLTMIAITTSTIAAVDNRVIMVAAVCVNAVFIQFYFGPLFAVPVELLGPRRAGLSSGFSNMFANFGAFSFAYGIGALKDATGSFDIGFYALAGSCLLGLAFTLLLAVKRQEWSMDFAGR